MGETELSASGAEVCRVQHVELYSGLNPKPGFLKPETIISDSLPSPLSNSGHQNPGILKSETSFVESSPAPSLPDDDCQTENAKSEISRADSSQSLSSSPSVSPTPDSITPSTSGLQKSYDCTTCGKKFSKPSRLKSHELFHSGERPFACKHSGCDKAYTNSSHLLRHMKTHQGYVAPLQICVECKAMFRSAGGLRKHMKTIHMTENEYPYNCKECGRAFRKKKLLMYHMHEHGGDPAFRCEHCNVQFTHKYLYNRHMRGHRTHPCRWPGCKVVLANWSLFRKHMAVHNREDCMVEVPVESGANTEGGETSEAGENTHTVKTIRVPGRKCPICDMVIRSRNRYYTHLEQHKEVLKCPHPACDRAYTYKRNLDNHIRTHHTEAGRFVCDICDRSLASKQKLKMHKLNMHVNGPKRHVWKKAAQAPRKDRGKIKRALAAKLAGIEIPYEEEKRLLHEDEEFRKGDPLCTSIALSSPESGFSSLPGALKSNFSWSSDVALSTSTEEGYRTGEPTDASDLQGPSETQRRNEDQQDSSSDDEYMYSGGDSSDEESGSGHCEDDDEEGDGDDDHDDDEGGDDDDDDDFNDDDEEDDDDEGEEGNGHEEEGGDERESDNHLAQGDGNSGKRAGSENLSRDEVPEGSGDFGVDRDSTIPSVESDHSHGVESPEEFITGDLDSIESDSQRTLKRKAENVDEVPAKRDRPFEGANTTASPDVSMAEECTLPDRKQLGRNVDDSIFEVKNAKEKASKHLPEGVWVSTFQSSIDHCLPPVKKEKNGDGLVMKRDR